MDITFSEEKDKFVVIYLDDITIYSKSNEKHLQHLERIFLKCMKFGISLNPKKSHFSLEEGKLLGHIISKDGIGIDPIGWKPLDNLLCHEIERSTIIYRQSKSLKEIYYRLCRENEKHNIDVKERH